MFPLVGDTGEREQPANSLCVGWQGQQQRPRERAIISTGAECPGKTAPSLLVARADLQVPRQSGGGEKQGPETHPCDGLVQEGQERPSPWRSIPGGGRGDLIPWQDVGGGLPRAPEDTPHGGEGLRTKAFSWEGRKEEGVMKSPGPLELGRAGHFP